MKLKKDVGEWQARDFVNYFGVLYEQNYAVALDIIPGKDDMIMKRMISKFRKNDRAKSVLVPFFEWVFAEYNKREDLVKKWGPLTIGFLPFWIDQFLGLPIDQKKKERKPVKLSDDMKKWLDEQKKKFEEKKNVG
jgi:hypothetical protein